MTLWHGRFEGQPNSQMWELNASIGFDIRLAKQDVRGSLAWAAALQAAAVLTDEEYTRIKDGLQVISAEFQDVVKYMLPCQTGGETKDRIVKLHLKIFISTTTNWWAQKPI